MKVDDGVIAELGSNLAVNGHRVLDGSGLVLAPAFVDPHVHLRTPGREDEETIATGTQAAAAGGYCTILAMPNTEPVVDSAAVLGALIEQARAQADVQVGLPRRDLEGPGRRGADRDGRARRRRRRRVHRRRSPGSRDLAHVARPPVLVDHAAAAGRPLRGSDAFPRRAHARRSRVGRARDRRLALDRRERDGRARPRPRLVREPDAAPDAPFRQGLGGGAAPGSRPRVFAPRPR